MKENYIFVEHPLRLYMELHEMSDDLVSLVDFNAFEPDFRILLFSECFHD